VIETTATKNEKDSDIDVENVKKLFYYPLVFMG